MATPILVSLAAVLFMIIIFYTFSPKVKGSKKGKKSGGLSNGVRRSGRAGKTPTKYTAEEAAGTPAKTRTPRTKTTATKEAATVQPKSKAKSTTKSRKSMDEPTPRRSSRSRRA